MDIRGQDVTRSEFLTLGYTTYGDHWQTALSRDIGVGLRQVQRWVVTGPPDRCRGHRDIHQRIAKACLERAYHNYKHCKRLAKQQRLIVTILRVEPASEAAEAVGEPAAAPLSHASTSVSASAASPAGADSQ